MRMQVICRKVCDKKEMQPIPRDGTIPHAAVELLE